jgi:Raf kinase inhibitor-like YbhB/YbcL family protein
MRITSPAFADGQLIPTKYTCDGDNTILPLTFEDVPPDAASLALVVDDPDAPSGVFDHWVVWNIPPDQTAIAEGEIPKGVAGRNSAGKNAWMGPCPPDRQHRYFFKLYALDSRLDLPKSAGKADLERAMEGHLLATAQLVGLYGPKRR